MQTLELGGATIFCGDAALVKHDGSQIDVIPLPCRSWACPDCAPKRRAQLKRLAWRGRPDKFVTLTCNPEVGSGPEDRARSLVAALRALRTLIPLEVESRALNDILTREPALVDRGRRVLASLEKHGAKAPECRTEFLAVFEATKAGEPHLHILARMPYVRQRWLSRKLAQLLGAPIVDVRRVRSRRAVTNYLAKYVGKAPHRFGTAKRYWRSRGYEPQRERDQAASRSPTTPASVVFVTAHEYVSRVVMVARLWGTAVETEWHDGACRITYPSRGPPQHVV